MIVLLDTRTSTCFLTLAIDNEHYEYEWEAGRSLALGLLEFLQQKLSLHDKSLQDVTAIGVAKGPGSFTGLRIGLTVLNTIASDRQIKIVGVSGDEWKSVALDRLQRGENDQLVMPEYGGEANITQPRK